MVIAKFGRQLVRGLRDGRRISPGVRILTYHGVVEKRRDPRVEAGFHEIDEFRAHLSLFRRCRVLALEEFEDTRRKLLPLPCIAITLDDGFRNNLIAVELLHAAKLPATLFVSSENVTRGITVWPTLLRLVLARGSRRTVEIDNEVFELDRDPTAFDRARHRFKSMSASVRASAFNELLAELRSDELEELVAGAPSIAMLSWDDVRAVQRAGIEIGSHGRRHELHHAQQPSDVRLDELVESRREISAAIGRPCERFAFPNGTFCASSADELRQSGYSHGFTMERRAARSTDDRLLMPRLVPGGPADKVMTALIFGN